MKRILVTAATSFIGKHLIQRLKDQNWNIIAAVRPENAQIGFPGVDRVLHLDMEDYSRLGELTGSCDCFVHLAWNGTRGASRMDAALQEQNLKYSLSGIQSVLRTGCSRLILAGSQAEYGPYAEQISEESPCAPNTEYGKYKLELYMKASELCRKTGVSIKEPRFFSLYGPGDFSGSMIISILKDMLADRPCKLTEGIQMWDFLHIDDAVNALAALCDAPCPDGVYNFGSGDVRQLRDYVEEMATITHTKSPLLFGAVPYPNTGMVSLWPDISKLRHELHWEPHIAFADGIQSILNTLDCGGEI